MKCLKKIAGGGGGVGGGWGGCFVPHCDGGTLRLELNKLPLNAFADMNVPYYEATITRIR